MATNTSFFSRRNRWILTFLTQMVIYGYMIGTAIKGNKKGASGDEIAMARWLNPNANGYRKKMGDPNSPSLWDLSDWKEWIMITAVIATFGILFYLFRRDEGDDPMWLSIFKTFILWSHTGTVLLLIPINDFHRRFLYNFRVVLARIVEEPAKELFLAFVFIVLFPLPGAEDVTTSERYTWLAIKVGIFYMFQSVMLGSPTYKIESPDDNKLIGISKKESKYYAIILAVIIGTIIIEKYTFQAIEGKKT